MNDGRSRALEAWTALGGQPYRTFWIGTMLTQMAIDSTHLLVGWQMLELTGSAWWVAVSAFAASLPMLLWSSLAGLLADRLPRPTILVGAMGVAAAALAALIGLMAWGGVLPWHLIVVSFAIGSSFSLFAPARSAELAALVPTAHLSTAALIQYALTRVMSFSGPVIAGALAAQARLVSALAGALVLVLAAAWLYARLPAHPVSQAQPSGAQHGVGALLPALHENRVLRDLVILGLIVVPFGMTYQHLLPVFARDVLRAGPDVLGWLTGVGFLGVAVIGLALAAVGRVRRGPAVIVSALGSGLGLGLLAVSDAAPLAIGLLLVLGVVNGVFLSYTTVLFHVLPGEAVRGRLMGIWGAVWGLAPIGALISGAVAEAYGVRLALWVSAGLCLTWSGCVWLQARALRAQP